MSDNSKQWFDIDLKWALEGLKNGDLYELNSQPPMVKAFWDERIKNEFVCSHCFSEFDEKTAFCPNCGAEMKNGE